jgi:hypothetical protein
VGVLAQPSREPPIFWFAEASIPARKEVPNARVDLDDGFMLAADASGWVGLGCPYVALLLPHRAPKWLSKIAGSGRSSVSTWT